MTHTIIPTRANGEPLAATAVLCASLNGKLAIHKSIDAPGYTVTHIPTGGAIRTSIVTYSDAERLLLDIEGANWNFRSYRSPIWEKQKSTLWPIVRQVQCHWSN